MWYKMYICHSYYKQKTIYLLDLSSAVTFPLSLPGCNPKITFVGESLLNKKSLVELFRTASTISHLSYL